MFSFSFLFILLFVENYRTNQFLVNFDKEPSFLIIPKILFLLILFLSVHVVLMMVSSRTRNESVRVNQYLISLIQRKQNLMVIITCLPLIWGLMGNITGWIIEK